MLDSVSEQNRRAALAAIDFIRAEPRHHSGARHHLAAILEDHNSARSLLARVPVLRQTVAQALAMLHIGR